MPGQLFSRSLPRCQSTLYSLYSTLYSAAFSSVSTLLDSFYVLYILYSLLYPTLPYPTLPYPTLPYARYAALRYSTLHYTTLHSTHTHTHTHPGPRPDPFLGCFQALIRNGERSSKACPGQLITLLHVPNSLGQPNANDVWAAIKKKSHICPRDAAQVAQPRSRSIFARRNRFCKLAPEYAQSVIVCLNAEHQNLRLGATLDLTSQASSPISTPSLPSSGPHSCLYIIIRQEACLEEFSGSRSRHHTLPIGKKIWRETRTRAQLNSSSSRSSTSDSSNTRSCTESAAMVRKLNQNLSRKNTSLLFMLPVA